MQTSTPIEAQDADAPRSADPIRDMSTPEIIGVCVLFTFVTTLAFGLIGDVKHGYVFPLVIFTTIPLRGWLYRRFNDWSPFGATCAYFAGVIAISVIAMATLRALGR